MRSRLEELEGAVRLTLVWRPAWGKAGRQGGRVEDQGQWRRSCWPRRHVGPAEARAWCWASACNLRWGDRAAVPLRYGLASTQHSVVLRPRGASDPHRLALHPTSWWASRRPASRS